jgi:RND family efflux transporter MFP subunit
VTPEEHEKAQAGHKKASARVAALEAAVKLMRANIAEIKATIMAMHLYAPFDGTVVEKQGEVGEIISPTAMSSSLGRTAVVTIADLQHMDVETDIAEAQLWKITIGQPASVSVSAIPSKRYRGRLRQILPMSDRTRSTVKVKVEILDPDNNLFPELAATVHFQASDTANSPDAGKTFLFVPKVAVFEVDGRDYVWVVRKDDRVIRRNQVEVATTTDDLARVESGLTLGDEVVLNPPKTLRDYDRVKVSK